MELRIEHRREHLRDGLADQTIHHRRHPQHPLPTRRLRDHHPSNRLRPVDARIKCEPEHPASAHEATARNSSVLIPSTPAAPRVQLDTFQRLGQVPAGQEQLPQSNSLSGVSVGLVLRRMMAALWPRVLRASPYRPTPRPQNGVGCGQRHHHRARTTCARLCVRSFPATNKSRPVLRPLLTSPKRTTTSRPLSSRPTRRAAQQHRSGI